VDGSIDVVRITAGSGYDDGTYYAPIDGDGSNGVVKIVISGGSVQTFGSAAGDTEVFTPGSGYTFATIDLTDTYSDSALTTSASIGSGTGASVEAIISPKGGHGFNAVRELAAHYVMMNTKLEQAEGDDVTIANDFREVGIVRDPYNWGTQTVASASTRRQSFAIKFGTAPITDFEIDEKITQASTGATGRVVEWDSTNNILYYLQERYPEYGINTAGNYVAFSGANTVTGANSGASATPSTTASENVTLSGGTVLAFTSGYANPELEPNSGDVIYIENRRPISRAADQTEDIKIVVEF
jgi:hypothetical protein